MTVSALSLAHLEEPAGPDGAPRQVHPAPTTPTTPTTPIDRVADGQEGVSSSAAKTLALLTALLKAESPTVGVTEVAQELGMPKSTTHRLLKVLEEHGFVSRAGARYRVGGRFFELSEVASWSEHGELRDAAYRPLARLFERTDPIAVHLGVLRGRSVFYVDKVMGPQGTRLPTRVGGRFPATCTGLGKAMLAHSDAAVVDAVLAHPLARPTPYSVAARRRLVDQLEQTRAIGYAVEREEASQGTVCVAAPILQAGRAVAALSICVSSTAVARGREGRLAALGKLAVETAAIVTGLLPSDEAGPQVPGAGTTPFSRSAARA
jgi:IclR family transcriptional regulator, acetate operon repressor